MCPWSVAAPEPSPVAALGRTVAGPEPSIRAVPDDTALPGVDTHWVAHGLTVESTDAAGPRLRMTATGTALVSVAVAAAGVVGMVVGDIALTRGGRPDLQLLDGGGPAFAVAIVAATAVGVVLLRTRPQHPVGWCFAALGTSIAMTGLAQTYGSWGIYVRESAPLAGSASVVASTGFIVWLTLLGLVFALTPDGRPLSRRWGWAARGLGAAGLLWLMSAAFTRGPLDEAPFASVDNPWGELLPGAHLVRAPAGIATNLLLVACAASLFVRFLRSRGDERRRLLWVAVVVVLVPPFVALMWFAAVTDDDVLLEVAAGVFVAMVPVSAALAITRYHLYDVERVLSRAVVYVLLSGALASTYAFVVVLVGNGIGGLAGTSTVSVALATLAAAGVARPLHGVVQDAVDRRFSRRRYDALRSVRAHVEAPEPDVSVEQVLRLALDDPSLSVAYWVGDRAQWVTGEGRDAPAPSDAAVTVRRAGRTVAALTAEPRAADQELLRAVLREAEPALESTGLRAAVQLQLQEVRASRTRIATAQMLERRRIERDLHDGAQQRLLALAAQLQAALINGEPARQRAALARGVEQSRAAVQELRALANGLHPAVLTDGGLGAALDDLATRLPVRVLLDEPDRRWPIQVEATAWFVACEAVTNAVKHAGATNVSVVVRRDGDALLLRVEDDGRGGADANGRGLRGLADRVEAVGGRLIVATSAGHGTTVEAVLPCES